MALQVCSENNNKIFRLLDTALMACVGSELTYFINKKSWHSPNVQLHIDITAQIDACGLLVGGV